MVSTRESGLVDWYSSLDSIISISPENIPDEIAELGDTAIIIYIALYAEEIIRRNNAFILPSSRTLAEHLRLDTARHATDTTRKIPNSKIVKDGSGQGRMFLIMEDSDLLRTVRGIYARTNPFRTT